MTGKIEFGMLKTRVNLITALLLFTMASSALGGTFYVDDDALLPGIGTPEFPFKYIQDGVDAAVNGDTVMVKPGTYNEAVTVDKSLVIRSTNGYSSTLVYSANNRVFEVTAHNVTINGFRITSGDSGIFLNAVSNCIIQENYFENNTIGINLWYCNGLSISRNSIHSSSDAGIKASNSSNTQINDSTVMNNTIGINLSYCNGLSISSSTIHSSSDAGIKASNSSNTQINANTVIYHAIGINLWDCNGLSISSNTIHSSSAAGINVSNSSNTQINANTIRYNYSNDYAAVFIHGQSYQNQVAGNIISTNTKGVVVNSPNNTIASNQMDANYWYAIYLSNSDNTISGNTISNGTENGIELHHADSNTISGNILYGNDNGIYLDSGSDNNSISDNNAYNNREAGINLIESSQNIVFNNSLSSNTYWGINISTSIANTINGNTIQSNGLCGVQLYLSSGNTTYNNLLLNNVQNGCDDSGSNNWNVAKQPGTNIIGGPYLGGNSWSDYPGRDLDDDGLGDLYLPHTSSGNILSGGDVYPLVPAGINLPPYLPSTPQPAQGAVFQHTNPTLTWSGGDPDYGDTVTYDVYFGETLPLILVSEGQTETEFIPGELQNNDRYFWRVISKDSLDIITEGQLWEFRVDNGIVLNLLHEDSGVTTTDASGNGNDGILCGPTFVPGDGILGSNAFEFDYSASDHIQIPYVESQAVDDALTLEAWIFPTSWDNTTYGFNRIVSKQPVFLLRTAYNGYAQFQILTTDFGYQGVTDSQPLSLDQWHHVAGTFNGQNLTLYVDGEPCGTLDLAQATSIADNSANIHVGEYPILGEGFTGTIDNVAMYNRFKTESEIKATYDAVMRRCEGDFSRDGEVDHSDLGEFAVDFGRNDCSGDCPGDFDLDGEVDGSDLSLFVADFGRTDCP